MFVSVANCGRRTTGFFSGTVEQLCPITLAEITGPQQRVNLSTHEPVEVLRSKVRNSYQSECAVRDCAAKHACGNMFINTFAGRKPLRLNNPSSCTFCFKPGSAVTGTVLAIPRFPICATFDKLFGDASRICQSSDFSPDAHTSPWSSD